MAAPVDMYDWMRDISRRLVIQERRGAVIPFPFATLAETNAGTVPDKAVTPASLSGVLGRVSTSEADILALETRPQGVIPSSVVVGSGSASVAADGTVTFTGCSSVSLNDVFDGLGADRYEVHVRVRRSGAGANSNILLRLRASGVIKASGYTRSVIYKYGADGTAVAATGGGANDIVVAPQTGINYYGVSRHIIASPYLADNTTLTSESHQSGTVYAVWMETSHVSDSALYDGFTVLTNTGDFSGSIKVVKIA